MPQRRNGTAPGVISVIWRESLKSNSLCPLADGEEYLIPHSRLGDCGAPHRARTSSSHRGAVSGIRVLNQYLWIDESLLWYWRVWFLSEWTLICSKRDNNLGSIQNRVKQQKNQTLSLPPDCGKCVKRFECTSVATGMPFPYKSTPTRGCCIQNLPVRSTILWCLPPISLLSLGSF